MRVEHFLTQEAFSRAADDFILEKCREAVRGSGRFAMALSGGRTPRPLYEQLGLPPFRDAMPWEQVHLFWGDERWAPLQGPDSNFAMAWETLVSRVPIPPGNVHAVPVETGSPEEAAVKYEEMLKEFFRGQDREPGSPPRFDLILLGVGADGHTASLFPGSPLLEENGRWAAAALPPPTISPATPRVTFTLSVINAARCVLFLVSTAGKRELLSRVLDRPGETSELLPAARVRPRGELVWFLHDET